MSCYKNQISIGLVFLFAVASAMHAGTFVPIPLTQGSFNYDVVIEKTAPHPPAECVTASLDAGVVAKPDWNCTFYERGYHAGVPTSGMPAPGTIITTNGFSFQLPASYTANNAVLIDSVSTNGTLALGAATTCSRLALLATSGGGDQAVNFVVHHADGTSEAGTFTSLDWFNGGNIACLVSGRINLLDWIFLDVSGGGVPALHFAVITVSSASPVTAVDFSYGGPANTGHAAIWAVSTSSDGVNYSPAAVTGFNQDMVVEAGAPQRQPFTANAYTTAAMEGATGNSGQSWYENGYVPIAPRSGIPAAGTTFTNADHAYVMPPSYTTNDAVLLSPTVLNRTITPVTPTNFLGLSFLTASTYGLKTIAYTVHHADGTTESGTFGSPDWFGNPAAWTASGRADVGNGTLANFLSDAPKLCYADVTLTNFTSAITSLDLSWAPGNDNNWNPCAVVLAVSGAPVPSAPVILVQPASTYVAPGGSAQFTATVSGDALVYRWQKDGVDLTDGGNIHGAATAGLTVNPVSAADMANYRVVVSNGAGSVVSRSASLSLLSAYAAQVLALNPTAYWPLNEPLPAPPLNIAANSGSLGAPGHGNVSPAVAGNQAGIVGTAFAFTNATLDVGYAGATVDVPYQAALNPNGPFTVEFWAKPAAATPGPFSPVCSMDASQNGGFSRIGWVFYQEQNNQWLFAVGGFSSWGAIAAGGTVQVGAWQHVVGVYDGTNISLYVNGQLAVSPALVTTFQPSPVAFRIGATTVPDRGFHGAVDEVAFYDSALGADTIAAHYSAATTNNAGYGAQVLAAGPVGYWHLDENYSYDAGNFTAVNLGTAGASANGNYMPGARPAQPGVPQAPLGSPNYAATFTPGIEGGVNIGSPAELNVAGLVTLVAWVRQSPGDTRFQTIVAKGDTNPWGMWRLAMTPGGNPSFGTTGLSPMDTTAAGIVINDGQWHQLVAVYDGTYKSLYVDGVLGAQDVASGSLDNNGNYPLVIGYNPQFANRVWGGSLDEVAVFIGRALDAAAVQNLYCAAGVAPKITGQPAAPGLVNDGDPVALQVVAWGTPVLQYQWTKDGVDLPGQNADTLAWNPVHLPDSGSYAVVITNAYGSVTSSVVVLTVQGGVPAIVAQSGSIARYAGGVATFSVTAVGTVPLSYQWYRGLAPVGSNSPSHTLTGVQPADQGDYYCHVSNTHGQTNSAAVALTVIALPGGSYPAVVLEDNPAAFYRLDETNGVIAYDRWNDHHGQYTSVVLGVPGCSGDGDTAAAFAGVNSYVGNIDLDFSAGTAFSVEAWVKGPPQTDTAIVAKGFGAQEQFALDVYEGTYRFFTRSVNGTPTTVVASGVGPDGTWQHVAAVYDPVSGQSCLYVNGNAAQAGAFAAALLNTSHPLTIGSRQLSTGDYDMTFNGAIDEVAIYPIALTGDRVLAHMDAAPVWVNIECQTDGTLKLAWPRGTLQSAPAVDGTYNDLSGAVSPHIVTPSVQEFFRVRLR